MPRRFEISVAVSDSRTMQMKNRNTSSKGLKAIGSEERILGRPGPRTPQGQRAKYNAVKKGIFANVVLEGHESKAEYQKLVKAFVNYFKPVGAPEEAEVEKMAMLNWRQRRLVQAELAELLSVSRFVDVDLFRQQLVEEHKRQRSLSETDGILCGCLDPSILGGHRTA